jgi:hypothetical protein
MKKPPSKTDLRAHLQRQTDAFLSSGGKVQELQTGESAYDRDQAPPPAPLFETRRSERTPLTDVVAALEARRTAKRARTKGGARTHSEKTTTSRIRRLWRAPESRLGRGVALARSNAGDLT